MTKFVKFCEETPKVLGKFSLKPSVKELKSLKYRRSVFVSQKIKKGEKFIENNLKIVRPATVTPIKNYIKIIGTIAYKNYKLSYKI
jgi:sialic acid synthase SpsE